MYLKKRIAYIPAYSWEETASKANLVGYLSMDINNIDKEQAPNWVSVFKASQTTEKRNAVQIQGIYNNIGWYFSLIPHFNTPQTPAIKINLKDKVSLSPELYTFLRQEKQLSHLPIIPESFMQNFKSISAYSINEEPQNNFYIGLIGIASNEPGSSFIAILPSSTATESFPRLEALVFDSLTQTFKIAGSFPGIIYGTITNQPTQTVILSEEVYKYLRQKELLTGTQTE